MFGEIPGAAGGVTGAGKVGGEKRGCVHAGQHAVAVAPGAGGEEAGGFAEAVADDGVGLEGEGGEKIGDETAQGDVGEDGVTGDFDY